MLHTKHRFKETLADYGLTLPKKILVLDLETENCDFADMKNSSISCVCAIPYKLKRGKYEKGKPLVFLNSEGDLKKLSKILADPSFFIVGHNLFKFDYAILKNVMPLHDVIERTIDTFALLHAKAKGKKNGLGLANLSWLNFKLKKHKASRNLCQLWKAGKTKDVIRHCVKDCELTFKLWYLMVTRRIVKIDTGDYAEEWQNFRSKMAIFAIDLQYLVGNQPALKHGEWIAKLGRKLPFIPFCKYSSYTY
jgi:hypothetical protein